GCRLDLVSGRSQGGPLVSPHREQSGDESGVRKFSGSVLHDMLWFGGEPLPLADLASLGAA
ncbi:MAG: hypothetical protein PVJ31_06670, partial [Methyloceanibacter sp.]